MKYFRSTEFLLIILLLIFALAIRSINFKESLNFSADQGIFSLKALEIYKNKEITLVGPPTSINVDGREIFQGSIIYYFLLLFLIAGNFDPILSSYLFTVFCVLMIIPLFFGTKMLINRKAAILISAIYAFLPYYIDYTKFLWNPNFQLALSPLLILTMGLFKQKKSVFYLVLSGFIAGILLMFHYQFFLIITGIILGYLFYLKEKNKIGFLFTGLLLGFSPMILFEIRNNFYNLNTLIFYLKNNNHLSEVNIFSSHYFLTLSLFLILGISFYCKNKINNKFLIIFIAGLLTISFSKYMKTPDSGFGMKQGWSYLSEEKAFNIIASENVKNYNVVNLIYDTKANVQKYLLIKKGYSISPDDYLSNKFLFVITPKNKNLDDEPSYEVSTMKPFTISNSWDISAQHKIVLLKRD